MPRRKFHQHEVREVAPVHIHQSDSHGLLTVLRFRVPVQPRTGYGDVFRIRLDADVVASQPAGDEGRRSASQKRIEDYAARRTPPASIGVSINFCG